MAADAEGLCQRRLYCSSGQLLQPNSATGGLASSSVSTGQRKSAGAPNGSICKAAICSVSDPRLILVLSTDHCFRWRARLIKNMCLVVEEWLHTTALGIQYAYSCRDPGLDHQFIISRSQPVTWETWFPPAWLGGVHHNDLVHFFTRPGRIAFMWKDTIDYITPYRLELFTDPYLVSLGQVTANMLEPVFRNVREHQFWRHHRRDRWAQLLPTLLQQDHLTIATGASVPSTENGGLNRSTLATDDRRLRRWLEEMDPRIGVNQAQQENNPVL